MMESILVSDMKKVALINHYPILLPLNGTGKILFNTAEILEYIGMDVELFTSSSKTGTSRLKGKYLQHQCSSPLLMESGHSAARVLDLASLSITGKRPSYERMNVNPTMVKELNDYNPDYIIVIGHVLAKLLNNYVKTAANHPKLIMLTDTPQTIYNDYASIENGSKWIRYVSKALLFKNYVKFHLSYYDSLLHAADAVVTPTDKAKAAISKCYPRAVKKTYAISPFFYEKGKKTKIKTKIDKILFMGNLPHAPNAEAIEVIENRIAPLLPSKKFIIAGAGMKKETRKNVTFIGAVSNIDRLLADVDLCIAPVIYGSGRKVKIFDYLAAGKAVIGTAVAFEGYRVKNGINVIEDNNVYKFAETISALEKNTVMFTRIQRNSRSVLSEYSRENIAAKWLRVLKTV